MHDIVNGVIASLEEFADPKRIAFAATSYPTKMKVIGVVSAHEKTIIKELKVQLSNSSGRERIELAKALARTNIFECQHIAFEFIGRDKKSLKALTENDIDDFFFNMDNWLSVDCFAAYLVGYAWREGIIPTGKVKQYYTSDDFWIRRIALVATVSLNQKARGGKGDAAKTIEMCTLAIHDHSDMINKALSWALRELAKIDKKPVENFINKYEDMLHSRVLKEVKSKLETGRKY